LKDWALIELNLERYGNAEPTNEVFIHHVDREVLYEWNTSNYIPFAIEAMKTKLSLRLQGIVPAEEIKKPTMLDENSDPVLYVGKYGKTSGMTWGKGNEVMSVVRYHTETQAYSIEWLIIGMLRKFSDKGDSGSTVFDLNGRIAGIMSGGLESQLGGSDITYAAPIEWILDDICEYTKRDIHLL
jgi:hypothetical protein